MQNSKLNILIYPMLSVDVLNSDSNYIIIKQLCNELIKTKKYNFFLLIDSQRKYVKDDLNSLVKIIKMPMPKSKKHQVINFNTNVFKQLFKKYSFDIIWNNVVEQGHHFKYFEDVNAEVFKPKVFNYHHYVIHRSLSSTSYLLCKHILYDQLVGSLGADLNYFHSKHCFNMLHEEAQDILNVKQIINIQNKSLVSLGGYSKNIESDIKYVRFTFIYNHRLDGYKNWKDTFDVFDALYKEGLDFQVIVTAGDKSNINTVNKKPYVIVKSFTRHSDYIKELSKCHSNVINSIHETYCISIAESIMNKQTVIVPNRCTFPELVDADYPYLFNSIEEQTNLIRKIITEDIREYNYKNKDKLNLSNHVKNIDSYFTKLGENKKENVFESIKKENNKIKIKNYLNNNTTIDLADFRNYVYKLGYASQSFPNKKLKHILNEFNYDYNITIDKFIIQ